MCDASARVPPVQDCLAPLSMQALPAAPESLCVVEMGGTEGADGEPGLQGSLYLNIGLQVSRRTPGTPGFTSACVCDVCIRLVYVAFTSLVSEFDDEVVSCLSPMTTV